MPELSEVKIVSDYINFHSKERIFTKIYHVKKGNIPECDNIIENFSIVSETNGKELILKLFDGYKSIRISVFMGMSGNWLFLPTSDWFSRKFTRLRFDTNDGNSLLLWGLYMGPKYRFGEFTGVKRGPDPTKEFEKFKQNILDNLHKKAFDKPICEVLLDQKYFNGVGNYLRSTILYYLDDNPFEIASKVISKNNKILDLCREIPLKAYELNGGQLQDWQNPFNADCSEFKNWVFYQKGLSIKDTTGRTFWYNKKWKNNNIYEINK